MPSIVERHHCSLYWHAANKTDRDTLYDVSWQQFEALVGEAFLRKGYAVTETASGADGGIDLVLKKQNEAFLLQCKQWKAYKVGLSEQALVAANRELIAPSSK